jgi:PP-loop superfamily ATP-utilizing enzyme
MNAAARKQIVEGLRAIERGARLVAEALEVSDDDEDAPATPAPAESGRVLVVVNDVSKRKARAALRRLGLPVEDK